MDNQTSPDGLRVAGFESRRAVEMARLLEKTGVSAFVSPAMREVIREENRPVLDFAKCLVAGEIDVVVLMTGVGVRLILRALEGYVIRAAFLEALGRVTTIARGPKPVAALREFGLNATVRIGEPNTWRDILAACREGALNVEGLRVAIQEHGQPSAELEAGLVAFGARVTSVPVYQWALPEDIEPLRQNLRRIIVGEIDLALFTSSRQVVHMLHVAGQMGIEQQVREAFPRIVVGSIGPTTSETLREHGIAVDFEPSHPRLGHLVGEAVLAVRNRRSLKDVG